MLRHVRRYSQKVRAWWDSLDGRPRTAVAGQTSTVMSQGPRESGLYRKLFLQSVILFALSGFIGLTFLFVLMPLMIRFAGNLNNKSLDLNRDDLAPRVPSFSVPQTATNEARLKISGYGEPDSTIVFVHNGTQQEETQADEEGQFEVGLVLDEGENTLAFFAKDSAGNESNVSRETKITYDTEAPEVEWERPEEDQVVTNLRERETPVKGKVNESGQIYLNDRIIYADEEGVFEDSFYLQEGENTLVLKVIDEAGNETEIERKVSFRP